MTSDWVEGLLLVSRYAYRVEIARPGNFGIALYSRYPFLPVQSEEIGYGSDVTPAIRIVVQAGPHAGLQLVVVHSVPPVAADSFSVNKRLIRRIATEVRHLNKQAIVLGDFNATIFSGLFRKLLWGGELKHAGAGGSYFSTWNAKSPFLGLKIDHILLTPCIETLHYERGEEFGSDHYPLYFVGWLGQNRDK